MTTWAARFAGTSSGVGECTTSQSPASRSIDGQPARCHAQVSARTGTRRSTCATPGIAAATSGAIRSAHELENSVTRSPAGDVARARASSCTYSPMPVRALSAGR